VTTTIQNVDVPSGGLAIGMFVNIVISVINDKCHGGHHCASIVVHNLLLAVELLLILYTTVL
jgi:hypothetical protein